MATVEMTFTPLPAHVRTARLVATAVARRSGVSEALLDEVRLAVGEACSRAVEVHQEYCPAEPVRVALTGSAERFEVVVTNTAGKAGDGHPPGSAPGTGPRGGPPGPREPGGGPRGGREPGGGPRHSGPPGSHEPRGGPPGDGAAAGGTAAMARPAVSSLPPPLSAELGLAVIAGLADDVQVSRTDNGLSIRMSWPSRAAS
jgi:anti-sigma regulatory factor (Ser/Thr protein kinase)